MSNKMNDELLLNDRELEYYGANKHSRSFHSEMEAARRISKAQLAKARPIIEKQALKNRREQIAEIVDLAYRQDINEGEFGSLGFVPFWAEQILSLLPDEKEIEKQERERRDNQWHDNIQMVKKLIREGANPHEQRLMNVAYDHWHPELALLWEIAIEALKDSTASTEGG